MLNSRIPSKTRQPCGPGHLCPQGTGARTERPSSAAHELRDTGFLSLCSGNSNGSYLELVPY